VKHVDKCIEAGVDIVCAQGGEGGGHTGDIPTSILLPKVVEACSGRLSPLTGEPIMVVGAGGIFDGRGLASCLAAGCSGVWVGTRFIASEEAGAGPMHKKRVVESDYGDTMRTIIYTGRPMRIFRTPYTLDFEANRAKEIEEMQNMGVPAFIKDIRGDIDSGSMGIGIFHQAEVLTSEEKKLDVKLSSREERERGVFLTGQCAGAIHDIKPAAAIVEDMVQQAAEQLRVASAFVAAKL